MAGFDTGGGDDVITHINVTPLVDVFLVLLIIFMLTSSVVVQQEILVDLPRAASGQSETKKTLTFQVREDGTYLLDNREVSLEEVAETIRSRVEQNPELRAVIAADKNVKYQRVVDLIDTIKTNGLEKFALNIQRTATE